MSRKPLKPTVDEVVKSQMRRSYRPGHDQAIEVVRYAKVGDVSMTFGNGLGLGAKQVRKKGSTQREGSAIHHDEDLAKEGAGGERRCHMGTCEGRTGR